MKKIIFFALLLPALSCAETISFTGEVNKLRAVSSGHQNAAEYEAVFSLNPTQPSCTWIKLPPDSNSYMSVLLMSKAQAKAVTVWYDPTSCRTITVELQ